MVIICGGACEFVTSLSIQMSYNAAQKANINQGLGTSVMISNCLFVTLMSYCCIGEKVTCLQMIGILMIIAAVVIISLFRAVPEQFTDIMNAKYTTLTIMWGLIGALFLSFGIMCIKWLMNKRKVSGDVSGIAFLFVDGIIGTICLIVTSWHGGGVY